ncbi:kinase-like protein [Dentipellis sp. KUC8613]|nr:kinase-like protein [Dentipellis sp. KUC8613]
MFPPMPIARFFSFGKKQSVVPLVSAEVTVTVKRNVNVVSAATNTDTNTRDEETKHLEALLDAAHDPGFLRVNSYVRMPPSALNIQEVFFDKADDLVNFSKALPHTKAVRYGTPITPLSTGLRDFRAIKKLGSGASGVVYLAKHTGDNKLYAIKKMEKEFLDAAAMGMLVHEQRALRAVRGDACVLQLEASFHDAENFYLVTAFYAGGDLRGQMDKCGKLQPYHALFYTANLILALKYIHAHGIIHRDIKPENILLDAGGYPVLGDFGLSKHFELTPGAIQAETNPFWSSLAASSPTRTTARTNFDTQLSCGTPAYCAPELFAGAPYSFAVDFWALGVTVFEMLCGRKPFRDVLDLDAVEKSVCHDAVVFKFGEEVEFYAQLFIFHVLQKDPKERLSGDAMMGHKYFQEM